MSSVTLMLKGNWMENCWVSNTDNFLHCLIYSFYEDAIDYVDSKISWIHESFPIRIKVSTDYGLCKEMNSLDNGIDVAYHYMDPWCKEMFTRHWNNQNILDRIESMSEWRELNNLPQEYRKSLINFAARIFEGVPNINTAQHLLASKGVLLFTLQDDLLEYLAQSEAFWTLGAGYCNELCQIYSKECEYEREKNFPKFVAKISEWKFYNNIPNAICNGVENVLNMHMLLNSELRYKFPPALYNAHCDSIEHLSRCLNLEQKMIQQHGTKGRYISPSASQYVRQSVSGYPISLISILPNPDMAKYFGEYDAFAMFMCNKLVMENDLFSAGKDLMENIFEPSSTFHYMLHEKFNNDKVLTMKYLFNEVNESKYYTKCIIDQMERKSRTFYKHYFLCASTNFDFYFRTGVHDLNPRYGWTPVLD